MLQAAGRDEWLGRKNMLFIDSLTSHKERKMLTFRMCMEFRLMIPKEKVACVEEELQYLQVSLVHCPSKA